MTLGSPSYSGLQAWGQQVPNSHSNLTVVDKVPPEMLHLVDEYWYQFPPLNPLWHSILAVILVFLGVVCITGNGMVIYIFSQTKSLRTPSNLLIVNLAFSDFLMLFTMFPPAVVNCYYETWVFGPLMCQIYGCFGSLFGCVSIWTMTMIAYDRYNVIVKGLAAKPMTNTRAILWILGVWANSLIWTLAPLFGWNRYVPEGNMAVCGTDYLSKDWLSRSYVLAYGVFVYFLPLLLIIYSYYYIVKAVSKHEKSMREQAKKMNVASLRTAESNATSSEFKLAKIALFTISLWFAAWTPYLIINFAGVFEMSRISPLATISGSIFAKANSMYNPIVYGISHPKYRAALYRKFPALSCQTPADENSSTTSEVTNIAEEKPSI